MALARIKVWNPGDVLTAADLNGEFNNFINNPITLFSPTTGPINFNLQAHTNLLPSVISGTSAGTGQVLVVTSSSTVPSFISAIPVDSRVRGLLGLLSSQSGTFSADSYVQRSTDGLRAWSVTATSSYSASVGTAGPAAGGRDMAGSFASTYVHWYAITTGPGSTAPTGLVSTNPPNVGPVALPTGYLGWTYLGASPYSSASTTVTSTHRFRGNLSHTLSINDNILLNAGASTALTALSYSSAVPSNSLGLIVEFAANTAGSNSALSVDSASTFITLGAVAGIRIRAICPVTSEGLSYQNGAAGGSVSAFMTGYLMPNGDA